MKTEIIRPMH